MHLVSSPRHNKTYTCVGADSVPPQILSPRTQSASGNCPHGHNPLADIVPLPQILFPPPSNRCLAVPVFLIGVRSYKPRPLFASSQKGKLSTHTLPLPLQSRSAINLPSRQTSCMAAALSIVSSALLSCTWCMRFAAASRY